MMTDSLTSYRLYDDELDIYYYSMFESRVIHLTNYKRFLNNFNKCDKKISKQYISISKIFLDYGFKFEIG